MKGCWPRFLLTGLVLIVCIICLLLKLLPRVAGFIGSGL